MKAFTLIILLFAAYYSNAQTVTEEPTIKWNLTLSWATMENSITQFSNDAPGPSFLKDRTAYGFDFIGFYRLGDSDALVGTGLSSYASFYRGDINYNTQIIPEENIESFDALKVSLPLLFRYDVPLGNTALSLIGGPALTTYHVQQFENKGIQSNITLNSLNYITAIRDQDGNPDSDLIFSPIRVQGEAMALFKFDAGNVPLNIGGQYHFGRTDVHSNRFEDQNIFNMTLDVAPQEMNTSRLGVVLGIGM